MVAGDSKAPAKRASQMGAAAPESGDTKRRRNVNEGASSSSAVPVPKDLLTKCVVTAWEDKYSDSSDGRPPPDENDEEEESDDDSDDGEPVKDWNVALDVPYAKCWPYLQEAKKFLPELTKDEYSNGNGKWPIAQMKVSVVPADLVESAILSEDYGNLAMCMDEISQSLYDAMNACTNIENKLGDDPASKRLPLFRSYSLEQNPDKCGMIFINRLAVYDERLRGQGIASFLLNAGLQLIDAKFCHKTGPVYMKPFPLLWEEKEGDGPPLPDDPFKCKTRTDAQKMQMHEDTLKVIDWWKKKGFREVEGSKGGGFDEYEYGYMVRGVALPAPSA